MAYREVGVMDIDQVIRRRLAGEKIRAIARLGREGLVVSYSSLYRCTIATSLTQA